MKPCHSHYILNELADKVLKKEIFESGKEEVIHGYTEYKIDNETKEKQIFRAHSSYRSDVGQISDVWYDWAYFKINNKNIPCQILCFFAIYDIIHAKKDDNDYLENNQPYCLVRSFQDEPKSIRKTHNNKKDYSYLIKWGELDTSLQILSCDDIIKEAIVVPNLFTFNEENDIKIESKKGFFIVSNRDEWIKYFSDFIISN